MRGIIRCRLCLDSWDIYLIVTAVLTWIINLITCTCGKLSRYLILKGCRLFCWSIAALLPCAVVVLYVDIIACLPKVRVFVSSPATKVVRFLSLSSFGFVGFWATSSLAQDAKAKAMPNTTAKDFSRDANECCFIVVFIVTLFVLLITLC